MRDLVLALVSHLDLLRVLLLGLFYAQLAVLDQLVAFLQHGLGPFFFLFYLLSNLNLLRFLVLYLNKATTLINL